MKRFFIASLAALALLSFIPSSRSVQAQTKTISILTPSGLLAKFNTLVLSDLQGAEAIAKAAGDSVADNCYVALIGLVQQMQTVASGSTASSSGVVTAFQKARLIVNAQRTTSPVFQACSPLKAQIKSDALTAPGALLSIF